MLNEEDIITAIIMTMRKIGETANYEQSNFLVFC